MNKRTPLYNETLQLNGRFVPFAGWELPVMYTSIIEEHNAVRSSAGIFDISHMGEIRVKGEDAFNFIQFATCNDVSKMKLNGSNGKAQYSALLNDNGGVIDDIIIYKFSDNNYLICTNGINTEKNYSWLNTVKLRENFKVTIENESEKWAQIAIQGPNSINLLNNINEFDNISTLSSFEFSENLIDDYKVIVAKTGYTGEDGIEIFVPAKNGADLWKKVIQVSSHHKVTPCGLGARDSLRLEASYPLYGHELLEELTPYESGIGWIVKLDKGDFVGRESLINRPKEKKKICGFYVLDQGIVREGCIITDSTGEQIGRVTSGTKTPTLNRAIGLSLVTVPNNTIGEIFYAEVRGKKIKCEVVNTPFYKRDTV